MGKVITDDGNFLQSWSKQVFVTVRGLGPQYEMGYSVHHYILTQHCTLYHS